MSTVNTISTDKALRRLRADRAVLALTRDGAAFGVFATGDQRRRPAVTLSRRHVEALAAQGLIIRQARAVYVLSETGRTAAAAS
jgi:tRNA pseudouridine-54 N-methylase